MFELPLFPLNTVLFPGMPLKLHIFEERYKLMINYCRDNGKPFGVALIRSGREVGGSAQPFAVGCTALITQFERLPDGRMNIIAVGHERFQIKSLRYNQPYLVGIVEEYPLINIESDVVSRNSSILRRWVTRYLEILAQASDTQFETVELPFEPGKLAYLASFLLNIPSTQKQTLLDISEAQELVTNLRTIYRREVTLLNSFLSSKEAVDMGPFSVN
jgi:uncharacterized protein